MEPSWIITLLLCAISFCFGGFIVSHLIGTTLRRATKNIDNASSIKNDAIDAYNEAVVFYNEMAELNRKMHNLSYEALPNKKLIPKELKS